MATANVQKISLSLDISFLKYASRHTYIYRKSNIMKYISSVTSPAVVLCQCCTEYTSKQVCNRYIIVVKL